VSDVWERAEVGNRAIPPLCLWVEMSPACPLALMPPEGQKRLLPPAGRSAPRPAVCGRL
jgi:hypothetical protein